MRSGSATNAWKAKRLRRGRAWPDRAAGPPGAGVAAVEPGPGSEGEHGPQRLSEEAFVVGRAVVEERVGREQHLVDVAAPTHVQAGVDVAGRVLLDRRGDGVAAAAVEEVHERPDA